jgi:glycosyltransferase involved in cell wall biosynthesis
LTNKILSICIPNYNQGTALSRSIKNLINVSQYKDLEIIISDNGSSDEASKISLSEANLFIPSARILTGKALNSENNNWFSGFGANLDRLVDNSRGEYIWILGSGDLINIEYLDGLLNILDSKTFDNVIIKGSFYNEKKMETVRGLNDKKLKKEVIFNKSLQKFTNLYDHSISCNITRRAVYSSVSDNLKFQDSWPHVERFMSYMYKNEIFKVCEIKNEMLFIDQPEDGWYTKIDGLSIYLKLGILYSHYLHLDKNLFNYLNKELFKNRILMVVAIIIQVRLLRSAYAPQPKLDLTSI